MSESLTREAVADIERRFRNAARRWARRGNRDKADAYNYAAAALRQALKGAK